MEVTFHDGKYLFLYTLQKRISSVNRTKSKVFLWRFLCSDISERTLWLISCHWSIYPLKTSKHKKTLKKFSNIFKVYRKRLVEWNGLKKQSLYFQKQPPRGVLSKGVLKICSNVAGEHPCRSEYWNLISAWVFSCKFATYFQNTFF